MTRGKEGTVSLLSGSWFLSFRKYMEILQPAEAFPSHTAGWIEPTSFVEENTTKAQSHGIEIVGANFLVEDTGTS